jgi:CRP/FNR family transcriptional regulator, cyclic AMP receptor protein
MLMTLLPTHADLTDAFIRHLCDRIRRVEEDLVAHIVSSSAQRLARTLLMLARHGERVQSKPILPRVLQTTVAEMVGTTRPRINRILRTFRALGYIETDRRITVNRALRRALRRD